MSLVPGSRPICQKGGSEIRRKVTVNFWELRVLHYIIIFDALTHNTYQQMIIRKIVPNEEHTILTMYMFLYSSFQLNISNPSITISQIRAFRFYKGFVPEKKSCRCSKDLGQSVADFFFKYMRKQLHCFAKSALKVFQIG